MEAVLTWASQGTDCGPSGRCGVGSDSRRRRLTSLTGGRLLERVGRSRRAARTVSRQRHLAAALHKHRVTHIRTNPHRAAPRRQLAAALPLPPPPRRLAERRSGDERNTAQPAAVGQPRIPRAVPTRRPRRIDGDDRHRQME